MPESNKKYKYYKSVYDDKYIIVRYESAGEFKQWFKGIIVESNDPNFIVGHYSEQCHSLAFYPLSDYIPPITETSTTNTKDSTVKYKHYKYSYKGVKLDPYRILEIYNITCPAQQHAIKKLLRAGNSVKDLKQDVQEVIDTLQRKLEMLEEDESLEIDNV